jgi:prevent-host-death family protein
MSVAAVTPAVPNLPRITRDTLPDMTDVSIRELRNQGGDVVDRAARGEEITITRAGVPVAELRSLQPQISADSLLERWRRLPEVDPAAHRADVDELLDWDL